jgi:prophage DNA circulation protein
MSGVLSDLSGLAVQGVGLARTIDNSGLSWSGSAWWQQLQPGSWRGHGFVLDAGETKAGRRVAVHEYPYRDTTWAEDVGKLPRRFALQAFIVGDDVYQQRDALVADAEIAGPGTLVHPTLGSIQVVLLDFSATDRRERGRVIELNFTFIVAGDMLFPDALLAAGANVLAAVENLAGASAADLGSSLAGIGGVAKSVASAVGTFTGMASGVVGDASRVFHAVTGLTGFLGRYAAGSRATLQPVTTTVQGALSAATTARSAVEASASLVNRLASFL